jgi:hypothetical protein
MEDLINDRLPHAPQMGLFVHPDIPEGRLANALSDYAHHIAQDEVLALYDATLSGNAKDGAVFALDRFIFQNTDLEAPQTVRYRDLVDVEAERRWFGLGGKKIVLTVNRGRATFELSMDFSGQPDAAEYVADLLKEAMLKDVTLSGGSDDPATDVGAVRRALDDLRQQGKLTDDDFDRLMGALEG